MSNDFADLFNPATPAPSGYIAPGTLPPEFPAAWRDAAARSYGDRAADDSGEMSEVADPRHELVTDYLDDLDELADLDPDSAGQRRRWSWAKSRGAAQPSRDALKAPKAKDAFRVANKRMRPKMTGTTGHITYSQKEAVAWFYQPVTPWTMKPGHWQRQQIDAEAQVLVQLADAGIVQLHRRVVRAPWPVAQWAKNHDAWTRSGGSGAPLPDVEGALSWADYLAGQQGALLWTHPTIKFRVWGIYLPDRGPLAQRVETVANSSWVNNGKPGWGGWRGWVRRYASTVADAEAEGLRELLDQIELIMAHSGVQAEPVSPGLLDFFLTRSARIGLPMAPTLEPSTAGDWTINDVAELADAADIVAIPNDDYVQVSGTVAGQRHTGYVTVLTIGRMGRLEIPERLLPWQVLGDTADATVEWSERISLIDQEQARKDMRKQSDRIESQWKHYTVEHDETPPQALREQYQIVQNIKHDLDHDQTGFTTRVKGVWRMAVVGASPQEVNAKVAALRQAYEPAIQIHREHGQFQLLREFLPMEPQANTAHTRRMPVRTVAAGMAAAGDHLGDRTGITLGETASISRRPACWTPFHAMEVLRASGFTPVIGGLGSGKTFLCALIVYFIVRAGGYGVILDPSGPLKKLASLPELRPFTKVYELTGANARAGDLNPYRVIVDPRPDDWDYDPDNDDYADDDDPRAAAQLRFDTDMRARAAERRTTAVTVLNMMLPHQIRSDKNTTAVLTTAAAEVGGERHHHLGEILDTIKAIADGTEPYQERFSDALRDHAQSIYGELHSMRDLPAARVLFPDPNEPTRSLGADEDTRLTIFTMPGLSLPDSNADPDTLGPTERMSAPLIHMAAWQTNRLIYDMPRWARKVAFFDENKFFDELGITRTLALRLKRDSRKYNARILFSTQLGADILDAAQGGDDQGALVHDAIIGDLGGNETAIRDALTVINLPHGEGYEATLAGLSRQDRQARDREDDFISRRAVDLYDAQRGADDQASRFIIKSGSDIEIVICDWTNYTHLAHVFAALRSDPTAGRRRRTDEPGVQ